MNCIFRMMERSDKDEVLKMMRVFYSSPAVSTNGSEKIFNNDIDACLSDDPYVEGYVIVDSEMIIGYVMVAKSYSTEFGKRCIWIEDIYIKDDYRGLGIGNATLNFIRNKYTDALLRLEVEVDNEHALALYKKCGFTTLPYMEMMKND